MLEQQPESAIVEDHMIDPRVKVQDGNTFTTMEPGEFSVGREHFFERLIVRVGERWQGGRIAGGFFGFE